VKLERVKGRRKKKKNRTSLSLVQALASFDQERDGLHVFVVGEV
jgi:hypothetical protein